MIKVMSRAEIDRRRAVSKARDGTMWRDWWDQAAMKTVLRNLCKHLPMSSDLDEMMRRDDDEDAFEARPAMSGASAATADPEVDPRQVEVTELERVADANPDVQIPPIYVPEDSPDSVGEETQEQGSSDVETAFAEGASARRSGGARRAVPGPYREPDASHLAKAWQSGWDSAEQRS